MLSAPVGQMKECYFYVSGHKAWIKFVHNKKLLTGSGGGGGGGSLITCGKRKKCFGTFDQTPTDL